MTFRGERERSWESLRCGWGGGVGASWSLSESSSRRSCSSFDMSTGEKVSRKVSRTRGFTQSWSRSRSRSGLSRSLCCASLS